MSDTNGSIPDRVEIIVVFAAIASIWVYMVDRIGSWAGQAFVAAVWVGAAFALRRRVAWLYPASLAVVSLAAGVALLDAGWLPVIRLGG